MQTECSPELFDFGRVEGRAVEAAFDAGLVTSDAGALLLGASDRAIDLVDRYADCFRDGRRADLIEHTPRPARRRSDTRHRGSPTRETPKKLAATPAAPPSRSAFVEPPLITLALSRTSVKNRG